MSESASTALATPDPSTPDLPGDLQARISQLWLYPIKSCAGIRVREALLIETGLEFDRAWMVVDAAGRFLTQRSAPRMALIQPQLRLDDLVVRVPGMLALHLSLDRAEAPCRVTVWKDEVAAYDMGALAAQWFSDFLGQPVRLVRFDPDQPRVSSAKWTGEDTGYVQFGDGYAVLVSTEAALAELNGRLAAAGHAAVDWRRFRPNVVIDARPGGEPVEAHAEDYWRDLAIATAQGQAGLRLVKPCTRCEIPDIDPATGVFGSQPNATLAGYRADSRMGGAVTLGMNAIVTGGIEHLLREGAAVGVTLDF
ncbi:MAG: MOSC N-terminal beta barrel domain-containing protein [Comamonas sp.]